MRLFLDANVLFTAAHNPDGLARLLFDLARHDVLTLISSDGAIGEARANLALKAPDKAPALDRLVPHLDLVDPPSQPVRSIALPEDDQLIFGAAVASRATHLLSGDKKHFGPYFRESETDGWHHDSNRPGVLLRSLRAEELNASI